MDNLKLRQAREIFLADPAIGRYRLAERMNIGENAARGLLYKLRSEKPVPSESHEANDLAVQICARLKSSKKTVSFSALCDLFDRSPKTIREALDHLKESGHNVDVTGEEIALSSSIPAGSTIEIVHSLSDYKHHWRKFGVCGDKHLGNRQARLDVMNALYDIYESEGVTEVYDTGNWIDGEAGKLNKQELLVFGLDNQINYWIENHPQRKGITTYFIAGDDHEGWYQQRECIEIGRYAQNRAEKCGREDLKYLGYLEADVKLATKGGHAWMKVMHPGGGSAYALSYTSQKMVESFQGGEKPQILLQGHYHKINFGFPREVYVLDTGTCCDQTIFMRKKKLQAHVGGWLVEMNQAPDGHINRFKPEFFHFYDRGYYTGNLRKFVA